MAIATGETTGHSSAACDRGNEQTVVGAPGFLTLLLSPPRLKETRAAGARLAFVVMKIPRHLVAPALGFIAVLPPVLFAQPTPAPAPADWFGGEDVAAELMEGFAREVMGMRHAC